MARIRELLTDLPRKMDALWVHLVPGGAGHHERVTASRADSPAPARLDALTMVGPGTVAVTAMLHPLVRRWCTSRTVTVTVPVGPGQVEQVEQTLVEWHQELAVDEHGQPILVADDDQIGTLPPAEWLDSWVRAWRAAFGHHVPPRTRRRSQAERQAGLDEYTARMMLHQYLARHPDGPRTIAGLVTVLAATRQHRTAARLGVASWLPHDQRPLDPLADEWETRFGEPPRAYAATVDVDYLLTWLDNACAHDVGIADFTAELRALSAELTRVLGEQPDQQWLGRCPAVIVDHAAGDGGRPCGAGLWQDPHASVVECPHCHATWGPRATELLTLAGQIRRTWPVDRRRRYTADDIDEVPPLPCPGLGCGQTLTVWWREVTAGADRRRWWRPDKIACPAGCPDAEKAW